MYDRRTTTTTLIFSTECDLMVRQDLYRCCSAVTAVSVRPVAPASLCATTGLSIVVSVV